MDCSWSRNQHHTESDGADQEVPNSRTIMGIGGKNEEAKSKTLGKFQIPSAKFQINLNGPNSKLQAESFWSFDIGAWKLFGIWDLEFGI